MKNDNFKSVKKQNSQYLLSHVAAFMPVTLLLLVAMIAWGSNLVLSPLAHAQNAGATQADIIPDKSGDQVALADNITPSDVDNVKATGGNGSVALTWNVATDNTGVKGYKVYYATQPLKDDGSGYALGPIDVGNKINYTVSGLTNGTAYYFAVTAYDAADNESKNYSVEVKATPNHLAADTESPKVVKAEATNQITVKVTFSEAVKLPVLHPESAFTIKNDGNQVSLEVITAKLDDKDLTNKTVLLTTAKQKAGASYILTAGIQVKDLADNPIVSGTSDTAPFVGTDIVQSTQQVTQQTIQTLQTQATQDLGPALVDVKPIDATHVQVTFSRAVVVSQKPADEFIITEGLNSEKILKVTKADVSLDGKVVTLTTDPQKAMDYNLIVIDVTDVNGHAINSENNATTFAGAGAPDTQQSTQETMTGQTTQETTQTMQMPTPADTVAPEDATKFMASMLKKMVHLAWNPSLNSAKDLASYILYKSTDGQNYGEGVVVDPTAKKFDLSNLLPGVKYFFKLTAKDATGNESVGAMTTFTLPETGPELILLVLGSLGAGKFLKRKKK